MQTDMEKRGRIVLYVPWQDNEGNAFLAEPFADLECLLGSRFGGFTKQMGDGTWTDPEGVLQQEPVYVYTVLVPPGLDAAEQMHDICRTAREQLRQYEVWWTLDQVTLYREKGEELPF